MDSLSPQPSLLRQRSFVLFWCARTSTSGAYQMQAVAVGWQLYDLTHDPLDLGLVGLMQFFPVVVLALAIGQTADHFDRRAIAGTCQVVKAICATLFALGTLQGWLDRSSILALILITGTARAFEAPTLHSIVPGIVPRPLLPRAAPLGSRISWPSALESMTSRHSSRSSMSPRTRGAPASRSCRRACCSRSQLPKSSTRGVGQTSSPASR